jgi:16S rRNA (guanine527-N7)-methyltransferase
VKVLLPADVQVLLSPFGVSLSTPQGEAVVSYLDLLLRWNRKINLTSIRKPEEIVQRHFGESLYLSKVIEVKGGLLDIGSGAGFPGLALKILYPELAVTLLEPVAKKRAFLKEVARAFRMTDVEVLPERLAEFAVGTRLGAYDVATARAVGQLDSLVPLAARCLRPSGKLGLWLGLDQVATALQAGPKFHWSNPIAIPLSSQRVILAGKLG